MYLGYRRLVGFVNGALPKSDDLWHKFSWNKNILKWSFLRHHTLWFFFATCATKGNKYSVHCTCRRLCLRRVKRENDTDRRCKSLNFRERRRYRNVRRDVTALIGWQRSHHWHPVHIPSKSVVFTRVSHLPELVFSLLIKIQNVLGYIKRGYISLPDNITWMEIYLQIKKKW